MSLSACYLMPHPPVMVPEIGGNNIQDISSTVTACELVGKEIADISPDTIIIISPHGPVFHDAVCIYDFPLEGDFSKFGAPEVKMKFEADEALKQEIILRAKEKKIPVVKSSIISLSKYGIDKGLDHGALVPLYSITKFTHNFKLLPMAFGMLPYEDLYAFGKVIQEAAEATEKKIVIVASGDLSHRLTPDAPAGYSSQGKVFDEKLISALEKCDVDGLFAIPDRLIEKAGECGLRSIWIMMGAMDGYEVNPKILSYEGPFGVGYCVAKFHLAGKSNSKLSDLHENRKSEINKIREKEDPYVRLARLALETYVKEGKIIKTPDDLPEEMLTERAGVFVSIKKQGELRGCIGTYLPTKKNIAEEIKYNSISAGCEDPRFYPVREEELPYLTYSVDILTKPEPVDSIDQLDPKKYGVIVKKGFRTGLLLPDLEGVDTVEQQLSIALRKAGIAPDEDYEIQRFEVIRH